MQYKKSHFLKNTFVKNFVGSVLHENALIFSKILKKTKKYSAFSEKIRYLKARIVSKNFFGFKKRNYTFLAHLTNENRNKAPKIQAIYTLLLLALKVKKLGKKIFQIFSSKFVGSEARFLVKQYLNTYISMYKFWYDNERWGFFDEDLTEKTKLKLMKYFWLNKSRRFLRPKIWKRAYPLNNFSFRYIKKFGYNMKSLKITDQLFFWHAFTRKKLKKTLWIFRTSQIFKKILCLKKKSKKKLVNNFEHGKFNNIVLKLCTYFFYLNTQNVRLPFVFFDFNYNIKNFVNKLENLAHIFVNLKNDKSYYSVFLFLFIKFLKRNKNIFLKKIFYKCCVLFFVLSFFSVNFKTRKYLLYSCNSLLFSHFLKPKNIYIL